MLSAVFAFASLLEALVVCVAGERPKSFRHRAPLLPSLSLGPLVPSLGALLRQDPSCPKLPEGPRTLPTPPKCHRRVARDSSPTQPTLQCEFERRAVSQTAVAAAHERGRSGELISVGEGRWLSGAREVHSHRDSRRQALAHCLFRSGHGTASQTDLNTNARNKGEPHAPLLRRILSSWSRRKTSKA